MFDTFLDFLVPFSGAMLGAVSQGVLWGIMALGVYITFKILDFADMTVDGSFALGGCVCALLIVRGVNPLLAVLVATVAGSIAGLVTGFLTTKFKIPGILAGILVQLALYSINLHVLGGPNQPLTRVHTTIMDWINKAFNLSEFFPYSATSVSSLITGIIFTGAAIAILYWFFGTELGSAIRSTGDNAAMSRAQGINTDSMQILALMIANALVAMSGSLVMQQQVRRCKHGNRYNRNRTCFYNYWRSYFRKTIRILVELAFCCVWLCHLPFDYRACSSAWNENSGFKASFRCRCCNCAFCSCVEAKGFALQENFRGG